MRSYVMNGAKVEETTSGGNVTYVIWGTADQREAEAARLLKNYPKCAYGTTVTTNGVTTTVERYESTGD